MYIDILVCTLIGYMIVGTIWGIVIRKVIENKGYDDNWFWWGFFFGIFALIVAITKPNVQQPSKEQKNAQEEQKKSELDDLSLLTKYKEMLDSGIITEEEFNAKKKELLKM